MASLSPRRIRAGLRRYSRLNILDVNRLPQWSAGRVRRKLFARGKTRKRERARISLVGESLYARKEKKRVGRGKEKERAIFFRKKMQKIRRADDGEGSAKRVAPWGGGRKGRRKRKGEPLIREHRRNWHALTASKLKYISTTRREADALYAVIRERFFRAEMKGRYEEREFFMNAESAYR